MKLLVTGGCGYVGTELLDLLLQCDKVEEIVVYDSLARKNRNFFLGRRYGDKQVSFVQADILDTRRLAKAVEGADCVYHLAARVSTPFADGDIHGFEQTNHWGTAVVAEAVEKAGVPRFIYSSSGSVYGSSDEIVDEDSPPTPTTAYGISKLKGERQVERLGNKLDLCAILRFGNIHGFNRSIRWDGVINRFAFEAAFKGRVVVNGDGEQRRSFLSVKEAAWVLREIGLGESKGAMLANVCSATLSINDILDILLGYFPEMELNRVNQHLPQRSIQLKCGENMMGILSEAGCSLDGEIESLIREFSFVPGDWRYQEEGRESGIDVGAFDFQI